MTATPSMPETPLPSATPPKRRDRWAMFWRLATTLVVLAGAVVVAGLLANPRRFAAQDQNFPEATPPSEATRTPLSPDERRRHEGLTLRHLMGGLLMQATEGAAGEYDDPRNQDPAARRRFLAEQFDLPADYPGAALPPDTVPPDAEVLMIFPGAQDPKTRMALVRLPMGVEGAVAAFQAVYGKDGWQTVGDPEASDGRGGPGDRGWLLRYRRSGVSRFVFVQERPSRKETLAIVFDPGY